MKTYRSNLIFIALPIVVLAALAAIVVLVGGVAAPSAEITAILAGLTLALAAVCAAAVWQLRAAQRTAENVREAVVKLIHTREATVPPSASDAEIVERAGELWASSEAHLRNERDGFKSILAAMSDGILVVDSSRCVLFSNPAARKILGIPDDSFLAQSLLQLTQQADLISNIENSIVATQACSFEFQLPGEPGLVRSIQARCAPYKNEKQALSGAVAVLHDITELRRLERMRTEFVSNVSHELRTPLTSLIGYIETLEMAGFDDREQAAEFLGICHRQAENLSRIVEDLLRLSRLEHPFSEIADAHVSLNEVLRTAVEQCSPLAAKRSIALNCETTDGDAHINGDRGLLVQAVGNLIENAINYNRENGSVTVKLSPAKKTNGHSQATVPGDAGDDEFEWQIAVSDTGIGIPAHAMQRVFERFYRVDKARSRSEGGTGLGLAIVKHIALAHGASVHVESEVNKGSTFLIRLKTRKSRSSERTAALRK